MIKPSVGRKVWYRPCKNDIIGPVPMALAGGLDNAPPLDATIIAVWGDRCVNLLVTDIMGKQFPVTSAVLLQEGDEPARGPAKEDGTAGEIIGRYAEWMPYQQAQAAKEQAVAVG